MSDLKSWQTPPEDTELSQIMTDQDAYVVLTTHINAGAWDFDQRIALEVAMDALAERMDRT